VTNRDVDHDFLALPLQQCQDAALSRARELGAEHADVRVVRLQNSSINLRDARLDGNVTAVDSGLSVRVLVDGCWGFAATGEISATAAARVAERAVTMAKVSAPLVTQRVVLAPEPVHVGNWVSAYDIDPFDVPEADRIGLLAEYSRTLLSHDAVAHTDARVLAVKEQTFYADLAGTRTVQQRVRIEAEFTAVAIDGDTGSFETMTTTAPPVGRGWEYLTGGGQTVGGARAWNWDDELTRLPALLAEKLHAPSVEAGRYDLVIDPTNLWLTIHESIGHATELDRALGYEANYAGTSFATPDKLGSLQYGTALMNVIGDRTVTHGLSTVGWDDEGVGAQEWDIVKDGVLVGYQLDRSMAAEFELARSNGCAYADSATHTAIQRMPNVSLKANPEGPSLDDLIGGVDDGIYIVGDKSWSIDMQRFNFQFTGQQFHKIKGGKLVGQVKDVAYQATTTDFWGSMTVVGGPSTYLLGGAFNCGKGQPGQVAPVSHGCPAALFENVNVLNSVKEAGR
jgi:TldD protein